MLCYAVHVGEEEDFLAKSERRRVIANQRKIEFENQAFEGSWSDLLILYIKPYLETLKDPLERRERFFSAFFGTASYSIGAIALTARQGADEVVKSAFFAYDIFFIVPGALLYLMYSIFLAFLISMPEAKHGPVRLYLIGLLLHAFTMVVIRSTAW